MYGSWLVEKLTELADGPTGCAEVARGQCLFASNISVTRSAVLMVRTTSNMTLFQRLASSLPLENSNGRKPFTALYFLLSPFDIFIPNMKF